MVTSFSVQIWELSDPSGRGYLDRQVIISSFVGRERERERETREREEMRALPAVPCIGALFTACRLL